MQSQIPKSLASFLLCFFASVAAASSAQAGVYGFYGFFANPTDIVATRQRIMHDVKFNKNSNVRGPVVNTSDLLIYYDPKTETPTTIGIAETPWLASPELDCMDNVNNIYYTLVVAFENSTLYEHEPMGIFGFNLSNPNITYFIELPIETCANCIGATDVCIADPSTGDIHVYGRSYTNPYETILLKIERDRTTFEANITTISTYTRTWYPRISVEGMCHFFDTKRRKLWIPEWIGHYMYYYCIDPDSGLVEKNISSQAVDWGFDNCIYDGDLDVIIGLILHSEDKNTYDESYIIQYGNPETFMYESNKDISATKEEFCGIFSNYGYDSINKIMYQVIFKMEDSTNGCNDYNATQLGYMTGISAKDGSVTSSFPVCIIWDCPLAITYWDAL